MGKVIVDDPDEPGLEIILAAGQEDHGIRLRSFAGSTLYYVDKNGKTWPAAPSDDIGLTMKVAP